MWNPFRRREKSSGVTPDEVEEILRAYGDLLCDEEGALIRDESCLPTTKERMKTALAVAIATARTSDEHEFYRIGYLHLASFLPGVGPRGVLKGELPTVEVEDIVHRSPAYKAFQESVQEGSKWLKKMEEETEDLKRELELLEQRLSRRSSG